MTTAELKQVLENHKHWINSDCSGWENMKANLREANLYGADLCGANLNGADLRGADLREADLCRASLRRADMCGVTLNEADLYEANLCGAGLRRADLRRADLRWADLRGADLCGVNLYEADLNGADLYGANLCEANLRRADLRRAKNIPYIPLACPSDGAFIGWKKARCEDGDIIVKLEIPEDARRLSATGMKCRCDKALVLEIQNEYGNTMPLTTVAHSIHDPQFEYRVGETVSVENFDTNRFNECSTGIHFFINRQDAINY